MLLLDVRPKGRDLGETFSPIWWDALFENCALFGAVFVLIGVYWVAHKNECKYIVEADRVVDWLNIVFLGGIALLPFTISLFAEAVHAGSYQTALRVCLGNMVFVGVALSAWFGYVAWRGWINSDGRHHLRETIGKNLLVPSLCIPGLLAQPSSSHAVAYVAVPPAGYLVLTFVIAVLVQRRRTKGAEATAE